MDWPHHGFDSNIECPSKVEVALRISLNIVYRHIQAGDECQLLLFNSNECLKLSIRSATDVLDLYDSMINKEFSVEQIKTNCKRLTL